MSSRKTILIVDDEPDAIDYVEAVLSDLGDFNFISSYDGEDGMQKAKEIIPDLIILDIMMPKTDGFKVFYELRKFPETKNIPVVMLTGVADKIGIRFFKQDMKKFMGMEPAEYLEKPLDPDKLLNTVRDIFNIKPVQT